MTRMLLRQLPALRTAIRLQISQSPHPRWASASHFRNFSAAADATGPSAPPTTSIPTALSNDATRVMERNNATQSAATDLAPPTTSLDTGLGATTLPPPDGVKIAADPAAASHVISQPVEVPTDLSQAAAAVSQTADSASEVVVEAAKSSFSDTLLMPAMKMLSMTHDFTGLPWWLSIALATVTVRTVLLPLTLMTMRNSAVMQALKQDITERREAVMEAARSGNRPLATERQHEMQSFMKNAGVAPFRVLVGPIAQFPIFISFFVGIRRLATTEPSLTTGGAAWFTDLSVSDPNFILPVLCGATLFAMTEFGGDSGSTNMSPQMRMVMRGVAGLSVPMTYWFPAAVFCYWIPNNLFSVSLGFATRTPVVKKLLGLNIDPATIPGTRAAKLLGAQKAGSRAAHTMVHERIDPALAAASYARVSASHAVPSAQNVKPVLLKTRPSKKAKATAQ